ncbi:UNVERIFIED_CONTAM: hypothetical protein PYX00_002290 [Menopon gallinae]|uniref:Major facilitator superfamily (MFS) profile domain-containing protein n=1 Tax=Menopon gallinae TaxID=328185 RepID=A0AAW2IH71_9NEOP
MIFHFDFIRKGLMQLWSYELTRMLLITLAAHTHSISVGLTQGYSAVLLPQISNPNGTVHATTEESSWVASLGVISTPFGALAAGLIVDVLGRKLTLIVTCLPYLVGWVCMAFANDVGLLYVARAITGFASGMTTANFLYVAEVSSKQHRSMLSSLGSINVSFGLVIVYTLGFTTTWQKAALIASSFSVLTAFAMLKVPESPSWLVKRGEFEEAKKALAWIRPDPLVAEAELSAMVSSKIEADQNKLQLTEANKTPLKRLVHKIKLSARAILLPTVYKPFSILVMFFVFQQGSGLYTCLFYSTHIFKEFGTEYDENLITVSMGVFRFVMAFIGIFLMAKIGRRPLAIVSGTCMCVSLFFACIHLSLRDYLPPYLDFIPLVSVLFYVGFSMTGFLPLPWILNSELFPLDHRGLFSGMVSFIGYFLIFISVKIYPDLMRLLKLEGLLWVFFAMTCLGTVFFYFFLPETKDKTLKEISMSFLKKGSADVEAGKSSGKDIQR